MYVQLGAMESKQVLCAVLGDIHANLQALNAVLNDIDDAGADRIVAVGDVVGYGANPRECVDIVRELDVLSVAGNHEWAVLDRMSVQYFNGDARDSIEWTRGELSENELDYLRALELIATADGITLVHSSLFSPESFDYHQTLYDVQLAFGRLESSVCFCGHSHVPVMFLDTEPVSCFLQDELDIPPHRRAIINVGSVGQPRDLDPRASYALYDTDEQKVYMRRVEYDVHIASECIVKAGLPTINAARIVLGR